jgi:hypothetical protein
MGRGAGNFFQTTPNFERGGDAILVADSCEFRLRVVFSPAVKLRKIKRLAHKVPYPITGGAHGLLIDARITRRV